MSEKLQAMDIYSKDITVPFDIAVYCRMNKYSVEAVNLAKALKKREEAKQAVIIAEKAVAAFDYVVNNKVNAVRAKMEGSGK